MTRFVTVLLAVAGSLVACGPCQQAQPDMMCSTYEQCMDPPSAECFPCPSSTGWTGKCRLASRCMED